MFVGGNHAELGKAGVALALIIVILVLPQGIAPRWLALLSGPSTAPPARRGGEPTLAVAKRSDSKRAVSAHPLLECRDVEKRFGGLQALGGVSLSVMRGEILALVGPNGSGKSTLINVISGHFPLSSGSIALDGESISSLDPHEVARRGVARTYQIPRLFEHLTVLENVRLCATFGRIDKGLQESSEVDARHWIAFAGLAGKVDQLPATLNLHERKFVEFARALAARPKLLLLDEVLCGLTPSEVDQAIDLIRKIRAGGTTIVFVEHVMRAVVALADRVAVLDQGKLLALGDPQETMQNPEVIGVYLGAAHAA